MLCLAVYLTGSDTRHSTNTGQVCLSHNVHLWYNIRNSFVNQKPKKFILVYIQQDATLHSLFYLETALYVSGGGTTRNM